MKCALESSGDFRVDIGRGVDGTFVRVVHRASGTSVEQDGLRGCTADEVARRLLHELVDKLVGELPEDAP